MPMARTEDYIIMPKNQYFSVYFYGHFISNCDTIQEAEQDITEHNMTQFNNILYEKALSELLEENQSFRQWKNASNY